MLAPQKSLPAAQTGVISSRCELCIWSAIKQRKCTTISNLVLFWLNWNKMCKFTQLTKTLHDRRLLRSRQISTLLRDPVHEILWDPVHEILPDIALFSSMTSLVILLTKITGLMRNTRLLSVGEAISQLVLALAMLYETFLRRRKSARCSLDCICISYKMFELG